MVMGMAMDRRSEYSRGVLLLLERRMDKADAHVAVAADRQRRAWGGMWWPSHHGMAVGVYARWPGQAAMGHCGPLACGPYLFKLFSKPAQILKFKTKVFPMSKNTQILQVNNLKHEEQLYFLDQLQNSSELHVTNSGTNLNLNPPWILNGYKSFWKIR
jgi:hypothetical protein